jgi:hypothetical protein
LHAIDKKLLESCLEIKKEMDNNQAKFPSSTTLITDEDFINLSYVLTSEVKIMLIETKPEDIKALLDEIDVAKQLAFDAKREKFLLEKGLKLFELEIENTIEVLKRLAEKRESIEAELKLLEVFIKLIAPILITNISNLLTFNRKASWKITRKNWKY